MADAATDRTEMVELALGGRVFTGWTSVEIVRALDTLAGQFTLTAAAKGDGADDDFAFEAGAACEVRVGGTVIMTGWVDQFSPGYDANNHGISVSGRDRASDLVDCSAVHQPGSWNNTRIEVIAAALAAPYGISIVAEADTGAPLRKFALQQGESVHEAIERMLRYRGLILLSRADGKVAIVAAARGAAQFTLPQSAIEAAHAVHDVSGRYSDYIVLGQASGSDDAHGRAVSAVRGTASDPAVKRKRTLVLIGEEQSDRKSLDTRAKWEATVRAGRAQEAVVTVAGWRDASGALFDRNRLCQMDDQRLRMAGTLLVSAVALRFGGETGTTAELTLAPPEAWSALPVPEEREASRVR